MAVARAINLSCAVATALVTRERGSAVAQPVNRYGYLDALRFLGTFIVCYYHFLETQVRTPEISAFLTSGIGTGAVVIFFIISGYVMPFTIRRGIDLTDFAVRRAFRLFPLYFVALAVIAIGGATGLIAHWGYMWQSSPFTWLANLLIVQDFVGARPFLGVSWTLALEIIWYIIFFAALATLGKRAPLTLGIAAPIALLALAFVSIKLGHRIPLGRPAMIYAAALGWQVYGYTQGSMSKRTMLAWVGLFIAITMFTNFVSFGLYRHDHVHLVPVLASWIMAPVAFTAVILSPRLQRAPGIATGIVPAIGIMSYSSYLLHPIALALVGQYFGTLGLLPQVLIYTALTAALTLSGYYLIELPGIAVGKRVVGLLRPNPQLAAA